MRRGPIPPRSRSSSTGVWSCHFKMPLRRPLSLLCQLRTKVFFAATRSHSMTGDALARPPQALRRRRTSLSTRNASRAGAADDTESAAPAVFSEPEPYVRTTDFIMRKFGGSPPSLIVHLHANHFRFDQQDGSFPYDSPMKVFMQHLRRDTVPHSMLEELVASRVRFYDGSSCLGDMLQGLS